MTKLIPALIFCLLVFAGNEASAQQAGTTTSSGSNAQQLRFYYYPGSNVYYNISSGNYWYHDDTAGKWKSVPELPASIKLVKSPRFSVYHSNADVWMDNPEHLKKYKVKRDDNEIKVKVKD
jgi:hypothetical protein